MPHQRSTRPWIASAVVAIASVLLGGCGSQPVARGSMTANLALTANARGHSHFARGEYESAAAHYREAMRISQALEDAQGAATNALNLSIAYQRLGMRGAARDVLESAINQQSLSYSSAMRSALALRLAILSLETPGESHAPAPAQPASHWLARARLSCSDAGCGDYAAINNVEAAIALAAGDPLRAHDHARAALAAARSAGNRMETANALRLIGDASIATGDSSAALTALDEAIVIDRELGMPRRIHLDLIALGRASALAGRIDDAGRYFSRALAVSDANRDLQGAQQARALLESVQRPKP